MRPINEIIIHATATPPNWRSRSTTSSKVAEVRRWHVRDRGWSDIGYHYLIDRDGTVAKGRPIERVGAHVKGHNHGTIGIALFGGAGGTENDRFEDHYTPEQGRALRNLMASLQSQYPTISKYSGHNQYAAKACPCFNVPRWMKGKGPRTSLAQSTTMQAAGFTSLAGVTGVGTAVSQLDQTAQYIVIGTAVVAAAGLAWIARERIKKWARGVR